MRLLNGLINAFSMYSVFPMPKIKWNKDTMKYTFCFFPLVGAVIGILVYFWVLLCKGFGISNFLFAAGMVFIPVFISGAIHIDGFIDTSDGLYSRQSMERKLEILKDPNVGAFGVIMCVGYFVFMFGLAGEIYNNTKFIVVICVGYILSRSLSGFSVVSFSTAKNSGLAHIFSENADKSVVKWVCLGYITICLIVILDINIIMGGLTGLIILGWFFVFKKMCFHEFGGITGDLAGYFLCVTELLILAVAVIGGIL